MKKKIFLLILGFNVLLNSRVFAEKVKYYPIILGYVNSIEWGGALIFDFYNYFGEVIGTRNSYIDSMDISGEVEIKLKAYISIDSLDSSGVVYSTKMERVGISSFLIKKMELKREGKIIYDFLKDINRVKTESGYKVEKVEEGIRIFAEKIKKNGIGISSIIITKVDDVILREKDSLDIDYKYELYFIENESKSTVRFNRFKVEDKKAYKGKGDILGRRIKQLKNIRHICIIDYDDVNKKVIWFK